MPKNGKMNSKKIIIYFFIFGPTKIAVITEKINIKKAIFILKILLSGYKP